eukprot:scaffold82599_cov33-Tisochrysis_lutea.AAC.2
MDKHLTAPLEHLCLQVVEVMENPQKERRLVELLKKHRPSATNRILVFALYKKEAARVEQMLKQQGFRCIRRLRALPK